MREYEAMVIHGGALAAAHSITSSRSPAVNSEPEKCSHHGRCPHRLAPRDEPGHVALQVQTSSDDAVRTVDARVDNDTGATICPEPKAVSKD